MMHRQWLAVISLLMIGLSGCASTDDTPRRLRVLTYNIHHGRGTDGRFDYTRLADVIRRTNPDVVALQEVDRNTGRVSGVDQPAVLGEKLGMYHAFAEAMPYDGGQYGEAVLSRFPFESVTTHPLSADKGREPRAALEVVVRPWGKSGPAVQFTGTHLCHQAETTRVRQVEQIKQAIEAWPGPAVLTGDFNFTPDTPPYDALTQEWGDSARLLVDEQPTMGANLPPHERKRRIDIVWLRRARGFTAESIEVIEEPLASDHLPVLVVLRWDEP